jgi:hypothetical protein
LNQTAVTARPNLPTGAGATTMNNYARYYRDTDWTARHVNPACVIREFAVTEDNKTKTDQQLYDDIRIRVTSHDMAYAYVTLVKKESRLVLLHCANNHATVEINYSGSQTQGRLSLSMLLIAPV